MQSYGSHSQLGSHNSRCSDFLRHTLHRSRFSRDVEGRRKSHQQGREEQFHRCFRELSTEEFPLCLGKTLENSQDIAYGTPKEYRPLLPGPLRAFPSTLPTHLYPSHHKGQRDCQTL